MEITLVGDNSIFGMWGWEIALDLFLGGIAAGLMVFSGVMRLTHPNQFPRALLVADLAGLPVLGMGMLFLLLDLSNKINLWRFYTTFQVQSAMSWGAWALLLSMLVLALRFVSRVPLSWPIVKKIARATSRVDRPLALIGIILGSGVGFYTGVFLSTIVSRPLWNTALLAPLFLVSGLVSGAAFLCLFLPDDEHLRFVPSAIVVSGIEFLLLVAFSISLVFGNRGTMQAGSLLLNGAFGWIYWGLAILLGLLVPIAIEQLELMHGHFPIIQKRLPATLKLIGRLALRFVIVYAGLLTVI